mmetsp:Transcript_944/g.2719  ORF Transcript_944/g.2719 Transcript_944/m.2719 type:complete len:251 (+) Transcript_944:1118-1870(+)
MVFSRSRRAIAKHRPCILEVRLLLGVHFGSPIRSSCSRSAMTSPSWIFQHTGGRGRRRWRRCRNRRGPTPACRCAASAAWTRMSSGPALASPAKPPPPTELLLLLRVQRRAPVLCWGRTSRPVYRRRCSRTSCRTHGAASWLWPSRSCWRQHLRALWPRAFRTRASPALGSMLNPTDNMLKPTTEHCHRYHPLLLVKTALDKHCLVRSQMVAMRQLEASRFPAYRTLLRHLPMDDNVQNIGNMQSMAGRP